MPEAKSTAPKPAVKKEESPVPSGVLTMTTSEYAEYSEKNGTYMGRPDGVKTKLTTQELRVLINAEWSPKEIRDKHGISEEELKQVVWRLSEEELREKPIRYNDHGFQR